MGWQADRTYIIESIIESMLLNIQCENTRYFSAILQAKLHLTHLPLDKMVVILQKSLNGFSWMKILYVDSNFTEVCSYGQIDHNSAFIQVKAWRQKSNKPLSEPILRQFTDP